MEAAGEVGGDVPLLPLVFLPVSHLDRQERSSGPPKRGGGLDGHGQRTEEASKLLSLDFGKPFADRRARFALLAYYFF